MITVEIKGGKLNGLVTMVNEITEKFKSGDKFTDEEHLILNTYVSVGAYLQNNKPEDMMENYFKH